MICRPKAATVAPSGYQEEQPLMRRALLLFVYVMGSVVVGRQVEASFQLDYVEGLEPSSGIGHGRSAVMTHPAYDPWRAPAPPPVTVVTGRVAPIAPKDIWACIAQKESGNQPLGCAPYCGRLQWLPSTWRAAGGTKYAPTPQQATYAQEREIAIAWLAKTSWEQWPTTSRLCGAR